MKFLFILLIPAIVFSQKTQTANDSTILVSKLNYKKSISLEDIHLKFEEVLSDSRCPKDVECVWAGEAKILIEIYQNGHIDIRKEIIIDVKGILNDASNLIYASNNIKVYATGLYPYPMTSKKKDFETYYLEISVLTIN
jgi:hypothetical protein